MAILYQSRKAAFQRTNARLCVLLQQLGFDKTWLKLRYPMTGVQLFFTHDRDPVHTIPIRNCTGIKISRYEPVHTITVSHYGFMLFHTGTVWTQGLTVIISLRFHFVPVSCERGHRKLNTSLVLLPSSCNEGPARLQLQESFNQFTQMALCHSSFIFS